MSESGGSVHSLKKLEEDGDGSQEPRVARDAEGARHASPCAMASIYASGACKQVCLDGLQIMGGAGYIQESNMQRYVREAVLNTIIAGTNETQRNTIGMALELGLPRQTREQR